MLHFHNKNRPELTPITEWTKMDLEWTQKEPIIDPKMS